MPTAASVLLTGPSVLLTGPSVLLTGFEPFAGRTVNPSELVARALDGRAIAGRRVVTAVLPVRFADATDVLRERLRAVEPELVICTGEAEDTAVRVERVALNLDDARIADNAGAQPRDRAIATAGPAAYWSTLPIKPIVAAIARRNVPVTVSNTAGTFVCNHVFYGLMHTLARRRGTRTMRGGFIHLPSSGVAVDALVDAIDVAIATALAHAKPR